MQQCVEVGGKRFKVIGSVSTPLVCEGKPIPIIDIPMTSDEDWNKSAIKQAVKHYIERHGYEPESESIALEEEREFIRKLLGDDKYLEYKEAPVTDQSTQG
ncbi:MAG: hypothetical protein PUD43_09165 [Clostridia bacterium]|nr:hypothetical protein [Clostridia bacterium]